MGMTACRKEGPQGPAGIQGEQGEQGETGAQGPAGPKGATGTANVIYSAWLDIDLKSGIYAGTYYAKISAPKLTQALFDKGILKVYVRHNTMEWEIPNPNFRDLYLRFSVGFVEFFSPQDWDANSGYQYRYILVPGGTAARRSAPEVDYSNYRAVCRFYGISE